MKFLVTGCAGFIGMHFCKRLLNDGHQVDGIDNMNDYYSVSYKEDRLNEISSFDSFRFYKEDISDRDFFLNLNENYDAVIHLAAQAGVRYSFEKPEAYINSNIIGTFNILEFCKSKGIKNYVYASSSSVYGNRDEVPFLETDQTDSPVSLYAATKKSAEVLAHNYSYNFDIKSLGLRFFTVYGPWGRPDMAPLKFLKSIDQEKMIQIYHDGSLERDFTYIDDITEGIYSALNHTINSNDNFNKIFNIGSNQPYTVLEFVETLESCIEKKANKEFIPFQPGDVTKTYASVDALIRETGYRPKTSLKEGLLELTKWYKEYGYANKV